MMRKRVFSYWSSIVSSFQASRFVRSVLTVAGGVVIAQLISFAFIPLLTRLYSPEAFGGLATFTTIISIATPLITLGYANAIVLADSDEESWGIIRLSLLNSLFVTVILVWVCFLMGDQIAKWLGSSMSPELIYLVPPTLIIVAFLSIADQVAIREGLFFSKSKAKVFGTFSANCTKLLGGFIVPGALWLVTAETLGRVVNFLGILFFSSKHHSINIKYWFGFRGTRSAAKKYWDFFAFRVPQSMINASAVGLPVILLTFYFGPAAAGQYSLTALCLGAPMVLIGQSVGEVFYPKITTAIRRRSQDAFRQLRIATLVLAVISFVIFGVVIALGPQLFSVILGSEWQRAGEYAQWSGLWLGLSLVTRPVMAAYPILKLQGYLLFQEIVSVIARAIAFIVGVAIWESDLMAVALFSLVGLFFQLVNLIVGFWTLQQSGRSWSDFRGQEGGGQS